MDRPIVDINAPINLKEATLAIGWFWTPEAQLGLVKGIYKTCVGYAGGNTENPTYHNIGDHTESFKVSYNEEEIIFEDLMRWYFLSPNTCARSYKTQYDSIVFYNNKEEKEIAEKIMKEYGDEYKVKYNVRLEPYKNFYLAEDYHQKYYLQLSKEINKDIRAIYPSTREFINSTAAMKLNSYLKAKGALEGLKQEIDLLGLTEDNKKILLEIVESYGK